MALINSFRLFVLTVLFAAVYFIYFDSENFQIRLRRQTDLERIEDLPRSCRTDGQIALTFDDGPVTDGHTRVIYDRLSALGIRATFHFGVEYLNNVAVRTLISSARILNHTIGMRWPNRFPPNRMSPEDFKATLRGYAERMRNIIQVYPRFLRFPSDNVGPEHVQMARELGFEVTFYTVDANDYSPSANYETLPANLRAVIAQGATSVIRGSYIVLLQHTAAAGSGLDHAFREFNNTYRFVSLDQCIGGSPYIQNVNYNGGGNDRGNEEKKPAEQTSASTRPVTSLPLVILAIIAALFFQL